MTIEHCAASPSNMTVTASTPGAACPARLATHTTRRWGQPGSATPANRMHRPTRVRSEDDGTRGRLGAPSYRGSTATGLRAETDPQRAKRPRVRERPRRSDPPQPPSRWRGPTRRRSCRVRPARREPRTGSTVPRPTPRYRLEPGICGERREGARAVGHHGQRRRRRRLRKVLKVVSPKRGSDDRAGEGLAKAPGAPRIGGHVNVGPLGQVSRIGLRQARKLAGQLPARLGGFAPAHHARLHHRKSVGDVGHSLRVDDDSCARTNRAERDAEALGHARDDTVGGGQKVSADLDPTIGDRCGLHASARAPRRPRRPGPTRPAHPRTRVPKSQRRRSRFS